jgi:anthranilate synthase component 1
VSPQLPGPGEVAVLFRTVDACPDPIALYEATCDRGRRRDTSLFESADLSTKSGDKSLVMTRAALRFRCHGLTVRIDALSTNGAGALPWIGERLEQRAASRTLGDSSLEIAFPPVPRDRKESDRLLAPSPLDAIRSTVLNLRVLGGAPLPPLVLGSLAYDLVDVYEELPAANSDPSRWPDYELWLAEELLSIHHRTQRTTVQRYVLGGDAAALAYHDAERGLAATLKTVATAPTAPDPSAKGPTHTRRDPSSRAAEVDIDDDAFATLVASLKEHIIKGDVFQIVPSRTFSLRCDDPLAAYRRLRALNPSPYMFFMSASEGVLFGASPESALTVRREGGARRVTISPIAGTRQRGFTKSGVIDADLDTRIEAELRLDEKEIAEHMMLVDLARNDVARVSKPATRTVVRLLDVVRYSHVMHLVSQVSGELMDELDALHGYVATMNMGTLVGAPKVEAAKLLRRYEATRRGPYGGAVGYLTSDGELDSCIVIRSARVSPDGVAHVRAGAGVVYDSDPAAEALETLRKAQAVLAALQPTEK